MELFPNFGKYAIYVWSSYGLSVLTLLALALMTFRQNRNRK